MTSSTRKKNPSMKYLPKGNIGIFLKCVIHLDKPHLSVFFLHGDHLIYSIVLCPGHELVTTRHAAELESGTQTASPWKLKGPSPLGGTRCQPDSRGIPLLNFLFCHVVASLTRERSDQAG